MCRVLPWKKSRKEALKFEVFVLLFIWLGLVFGSCSTPMFESKQKTGAWSTYRQVVQGRTSSACVIIFWAISYDELLSCCTCCTYFPVAPGAAAAAAAAALFFLVKASSQLSVQSETALNGLYYEFLCNVIALHANIHQQPARLSALLSSLGPPENVLFR